MNVLVTGGCGFIGSNLVDYLLDLGHEVTVIDDLSSGKVDYCRKKVQYYFEDFKNILLKHEFEKKFDVIFHLAAEARIQPSFNNPLYTCYNNAYGTSVVCEYAREHNCKIIYAGSSSFYGGVYLNPYTFAKWQGEEVIKMYSKVYGIKSSIARFFNVYGPRNPEIGQYTPVVAIFEKQFTEKRPLTIIGDGEQKRDFTHVRDICTALVAMSQLNLSGKVLNIGTGVNYSINEIANLFDGEKRYLPARPGEARETLADITETIKTIKWKPTIQLKDYISNYKLKGEKDVKTIG